jgi:AAA15 family ATPase/GTPase
MGGFGPLLVDASLWPYFELTNRWLMLNSLEIRNYRNLRHLIIPKLGRVNLLIGKNNTGKTSVLEAVAIYASTAGELPVIKGFLQQRGEYYTNSQLSNILAGPSSPTQNNLKSLSALYTDQKSEFSKEESIYIGECEEDDVIKDNSVHVELYKSYKTIRTDESGAERIEYLSIKEGGDVNGTEYRYEIKFWRDIKFWQYSINNEYLFDNGNVSVLSRFQYVDSRGKTQQTVETLYKDVALSEKESDVIRALKIIEPKIDRFSLIDGSKPIVRLGSDQIRPLSSMGDGINRVFSIILSMVNCQGAYLLIDEFENGLHYSVQEKLWEIIFYLAERLDIQVFATTHSLDCVEAFSVVLSNGERDDTAGTMIRLDNYEGNIIAVVYAADEIRATTNVQVDPR